MRALRRLLKALPYALLFLLLLGFAMKNWAPVVVRYYLGAEWQAPLVFVLFVAFAIGMGVGGLACLVHILKQRREIGRLRRRLDAPPPPASADGAA